MGGGGDGDGRVGYKITTDVTVVSVRWPCRTMRTMLLIQSVAVLLVLYTGRASGRAALVLHSNGALVPQDTAEVEVTRDLHYQALKNFHRPVSRTLAVGVGLFNHTTSGQILSGKTVPLRGIQGANRKCIYN